MDNYSIKIYKAKEENIDEMTFVYNDAIEIFPSNIRKNSDRSIFSDIFNSNNIFIIERSDISKIIGWIAYKISENHIFIVGLYLLLDEQRKGIGTKVLNHCFNTLWKNTRKVVILNALKNATWSIEFYKRNGFTVYDKTIEYGNDLKFLKTKEIEDWEIVMFKYI